MRALAAIRSIRYSLGAPHPVAELSLAPQHATALAALGTKGLLDYAQSSLSPVELASDAAHRTLCDAGLPAAEVDAVIYATTTFWDERFRKESDIAWLLHELGLCNAFPIGVFLPGCANAVVATRMAVNLVRAEGYRNVLVVSTDKVMPGDATRRVMWPDVSVLSDGAASALVSAAGSGDWDILAVTQRSAPQMWDLDSASNLAAFLVGTVRGAKQTVADLLAATGLCSSEFGRFITNNYNVPVMNMIASCCGFESHQVYVDNVARFAHAYAADVLINLHDAARDSNCRVPGELQFLLATGHKNWAAMVLRAA